MGAPESGLPPEGVAHYASGYEANRLQTGFSRLEFERTKDILLRHLPVAPAVIIDVGGGPGAYSGWLADQGYQVHLVDAMPIHIEQARLLHGSRLAGSAVGDARKLDYPRESADAVLLMGPLYHLTDRGDRARALGECRRVLKPDGVLCAVGISRFASSLDGLTKGYLDDPEFQRIVERDLTQGQHRNPGNHPFYFTTAYFHLPQELSSEVEEAGFDHLVALGVEGPGWLLQNFDDHWQDAARRDRLLRLLRDIEAEPSLLGVSAHIMVVARKPE